MNTVKEARTIFVLISFLTLVFIILSTGPYLQPVTSHGPGPRELSVAEGLPQRGPFVDIIKDMIQRGDGLKDIDEYSKLQRHYRLWINWKPKADAAQGEGADDGPTADQGEDSTYDGVSGTKGNLSAKFYVLGFYVDDEYILPSSYKSMVKHGRFLSAVAPFWYRLSPADASKLQEHHPEEGFTKEEMKRIIEKAKSQDMEVLMLVHNLLYGGSADGKELAKNMLATMESRKMFIDSVEGIVKEFEYDGINIDIENIYVSDRDKFSALIKELHDRLSPKGYKITVCVPAKTSDNLSNTWSGPFDYGDIAKYSDKVAIMTYDEHGYSSGPGPVASYNWVRNVMEYALENMPAKKILMGIPGYGFDWTKGKKGARYISYAQAINTASSRGAAIKWDDNARVPHFEYWENGQKHEVWFESKYSLEHKLDIAKEYDIGGIALWRIGLEDAGAWEVIGDILGK